jgi:hypothetical protein
MARSQDGGIAGSRYTTRRGPGRASQSVGAGQSPAKRFGRAVYIDKPHLVEAEITEQTETDKIHESMHLD